MLILRNVNPYRLNSHGTGNARQATPPSTLAAGPTPICRNIGFAAKGSPHAMMLRRNVLAATAEAAKGPYVSTRKLIHCWKIAA